MRKFDQNEPFMFYALTLLVSLCFSTTITASVLDKVSLHDKIGQMLLIGFDGKTVTKHSPIVQAIEKNNIGGVILFDYDYHKKTYDRNIESPEQVQQLNNDLHYFAKEANLKHNRPQVPLLISVDYEGGRVNRLGEQYGFPPIPSAAEVGKGTMEAAALTAETMAQTLKKAHFNLNFAPVLDVGIAAI